MEITWIAASDEQEMGRIGANILNEQIAAKPSSVLLLPTGQTPVTVYDNLAERKAQGKLNLSKIHTVNLDEYVPLPPNHPQSYHAFMKKNLFDRVGLTEKQTRLPRGDAADLLAECRDYDEHVRRLGGIDFALLGVGHNGHIGFNEPSDNFSAETHLVDLTPSTRQANARFFESLDEVPTQAVTMGVLQIMQSARILLLCGPDKREIIESAFSGPITPRNPASVLRLHRDVTIVHCWKRYTILK